MIPSIDVDQLSPAAQKLVAASAPLKVQELASRGVAPGLKPAEILTVLLVLVRTTERPTVKETAEKTLANLPSQLLNAALSSELHPAVIDSLARAYPTRLDVLEKLFMMPTITPDTVEELAQTATEAVCELIATNEERLLAHPRIIERLYMNKRARMSTTDRLVELAVRNKIELTGISAWKEAALAIQNEIIFLPSPEPTPDDVMFQETQELAERLSEGAVEDTYEETDEGEEILKDKYLPLYQRIANMTVSQKVRRAMLGTKEERMLLVRDNNRIVATAAIRSPLIQEPEIAMISKNRNMPEEVLRVIGSTPDLVKSYGVKKSLVENPKCPVMISTKLIPHLRESDLKALAKSKNIAGPVKDAARRHLSRRAN